MSRCSFARGAQDPCQALVLVVGRMRQQIEVGKQLECVGRCGIWIVH